MEGGDIAPGLPLTVLTRAAARFEAARRLDLDPATTDPRERRLHGHGFIASTALGAGANGAMPTITAAEQALARATGHLDYRLLNDLVAMPTDLGLAAWLAARPGLEGGVVTTVQSTRDRGVQLRRTAAGDEAMHWRRYRFEAAHRLPRVPLGHKCGRLHGHGFEVILYLPVAGAVTTDVGARLDAAWAPLAARLDRHCLNEIAGLENPTSEMLAAWILARLRPVLPTLARVAVYETASCGAMFDGERYRIWKDFSFDSAVRGSSGRDGSIGTTITLGARATGVDSKEMDAKESNATGSGAMAVFGHTFGLRLWLSAPLDPVLGWTVDFGDVKAAFGPLFRAIDHQPLFALADGDETRLLVDRDGFPRLADLAEGDTTVLARWLYGQARERLPALDGLELFETEGVGASVTTSAAEPALPF